MSDPAPPLVHVTIPAYGDDALLREAIASVLGQEHPGWRLTISDDGPPAPGLEEWVAALGDPRVGYGRNPARLGLNRNFQHCVEAAQAPYVVVMGADDRMLPSYVGDVTDAAASYPDAAWIQPAVRVIDARGRPVRTLADRVKARLAPRVHPGQAVVLGGEQLMASLLRGNWMYFPAVAFRTDVVRRYGFRPGYDVVLDLDLYLRMLVDGATGVYLGSESFEYRRHDASLSSREAVSGERFEEEGALFAEARRSAAEHGWPLASRAARVRLTSRLHALARVPEVRDLRTAGALARYALLP